MVPEDRPVRIGRSPRPRNLGGKIGRAAERLPPIGGAGPSSTGPGSRIMACRAAAANRGPLSEPSLSEHSFQFFACCPHRLPFVARCVHHDEFLPPSGGSHVTESPLLARSANPLRISEPTFDECGAILRIPTVWPASAFGEFSRAGSRGDLPVQQSTKAELIINMKTAKNRGQHRRRGCATAIFAPKRPQLSRAVAMQHCHAKEIQNVYRAPPYPPP